jgi:hypothetical protein
MIGSLQKTGLCGASFLLAVHSDEKSTSNLNHKERDMIRQLESSGANPFTTHGHDRVSSDRPSEGSKGDQSATEWTIYRSPLRVPDELRNLLQQLDGEP